MWNEGVPVRRVGLYIVGPNVGLPPDHGRVGQNSVIADTVDCRSLLIVISRQKEFAGLIGGHVDRVSLQWDRADGRKFPGFVVDTETGHSKVVGLAAAGE